MLVAQLAIYLTTSYSEGVRNEHRAYLRNLGEKGKLLMSGIFPDKSGALIIWSVESVDEARALSEGDPFHRERIFQSTLKEWKIAFNFTVDPPIVPS